MNPLEWFYCILTRRFSGHALYAAIDAPDDPVRPWFLDVGLHINEPIIVVEWRAGAGLRIHLPGDDGACGMGPTEVARDVYAAVDRVESLLREYVAPIELDDFLSRLPDGERRAVEALAAELRRQMELYSNGMTANDAGPATQDGGVP